MHRFQAIHFQVGFISLFGRVETACQQDFSFVFFQQEIGLILIVFQSRLTGQGDACRDIIPVPFGGGKHCLQEIEVAGFCFQVQFSRTAHTVGQCFHRSGNVHAESPRQLRFQLAEQHGR